MKRAFILVILFWFAAITCMAQDKTTTTLFAPITFTYHTSLKSTGILFTQPTLVKPLANYSFNYTLPKGAIFCRMEDALHSHFNIWIKFRMGDDDRYSN